MIQSNLTPDGSLAEELTSDVEASHRAEVTELVTGKRAGLAAALALVATLAAAPAHAIDCSQAGEDGAIAIGRHAQWKAKCDDLSAQKPSNKPATAAPAATSEAKQTPAPAATKPKPRAAAKPTGEGSKPGVKPTAPNEGKQPAAEDIADMKKRMVALEDTNKQQDATIGSLKKEAEEKSGSENVKTGAILLETGLLAGLLAWARRLSRKGKLASKKTLDNEDRIEKVEKKLGGQTGQNEEK
jgi:hypothetical protein